MKREFANEAIAILESLGIDPSIFLSLVMIIWVTWDVRNYRKNKDWRTRPFINKFNFISRVFGMIVFITMAILFHLEDHR